MAIDLNDDDLQVARLLEQIHDIEPEPSSTQDVVAKIRDRILVTPLVAQPGVHSRTSARRIAFGSVTLVAAVCFAIVFVVSMFDSRSAIAQIQERLSKVKSVKYSVHEQPEGEAIRNYQIFVSEPGRTRIEVGDEITIVDLSKKKMIHLNRQTRYAKVTTGFNPRQALSIYDELRRQSFDSLTKLPDRQIDDKETVGFLIDNGSTSRREMKLWTDSVTSLPVRVESVMTPPRDSVLVRPVITSVADHFVFDEPIDETLFVIEPPAGYTVELDARYMASAQEVEDAGKLVVKPLVGLGLARFGMSQSEVIQKIGKPDRVKTLNGVNVSLDYASRGFTLMFDSSGFSAITLLDISANSVNHPFTGSTDKGIRLGATKAEIIRQYGPGDGQVADSNLLQYRKHGVTCFLRDDRLVQMMIYNRAK